MLDGGGSGYGGTRWAGMSVTDMWLAIGNQETTRHWELLTGWRKSYELTLQHMTAVKNYRENLAAAWPPEKSPAAAAYVAQLDTLIANLQHTYDAAVANYSAFSGATLALSSARQDLERVFNEYIANEGKLAEHEKEKANRPVAAGKSVVPPLKSPVAEGRQAELESQARSIMYGLSSEIMQARAQVAQPPKYSPGRQRGEAERDPEAIALSPSPIPPVVPFDPRPGGSGVGTAQAMSHSPLSVPGPPPSSTSQSPGLVLGSASQPPATPASPPSVGAPPLGTPTPTPPSTSPMMPSPLSPTVNGVQPITGRGTPSSGYARPSATPAVTPRAMPPGGVIGSIPGVGVGQQPGSIPRTPSQVNPVGGLITPNSATTGSGGSSRTAPAHMQPIGQAPSRVNGQDEEAGSPQRWDPDNPWETDEGVAPVLKPRPERIFDPGPAIGLH